MAHATAAAVLVSQAASQQPGGIQALSSAPACMHSQPGSMHTSAQLACMSASASAGMHEQPDSPALGVQDTVFAKAHSLHVQPDSQLAKDRVAPSSCMDSPAAFRALAGTASLSPAPLSVGNSHEDPALSWEQEAMAAPLPPSPAANAGEGEPATEPSPRTARFGCFSRFSLSCCSTFAQWLLVLLAAVLTCWVGWQADDTSALAVVPQLQPDALAAADGLPLWEQVVAASAYVLAWVTVVSLAILLPYLRRVSDGALMAMCVPVSVWCAFMLPSWLAELGPGWGNLQSAGGLRAWGAATFVVVIAVWVWSTVHLLVQQALFQASGM